MAPYVIESRIRADADPFERWSRDRVYGAMAAHDSAARAGSIPAVALGGDRVPCIRPRGGRDGWPAHARPAPGALTRRNARWNS